MADIVVVYHSGYGHTQRLAQAVAEGAGAHLLAIDPEGNLPAGGWEQLAAADAIVFGAPTYMGGPSWQFKKFADASSKPWFGLAIFVAVITPIFHNYWASPEAQVMMQKQAFNKNLAIVGGLLVVAAFGAGALSVDGRKRP